MGEALTEVRPEPKRWLGQILPSEQVCSSPAQRGGGGPSAERSEEPMVERASPNHDSCFLESV
jgi:hypothetical protein